MQEASELLPSTIEEATKGTPVVMLLQVVPRQNIEAFLAIELTKLASLINVDERLNLQPHQIPFIAAQLIDQYKAESLADFKICFQRGAIGKYDDKLLRLDSAVIGSWMTKYLDEKYEVLVAQLSAEKDNPYEVRKSAKTDMIVKLMKDALEQDGFQAQEKNNAKDNEYQRWKLQQQEARSTKQAHFNRVASEFYSHREGVNVARYSDDNGYYVMAENESDAEKIYSLASSTNGPKT
jgi:hypothetical protein